MILNIQLFGGRGASSGKPYKYNGKMHNYGDEYKTLFQSGKIKFITPNKGATTSPLETQTKGRIYVTVNSKQNKIQYISFYDKNNKRYKQIDVNGVKHYIDGTPYKTHTHLGYEHDEYGKPRKINKTELNILKKVVKLWYNYTSRK